MALKEVRKEKGFTQAYLAEKLGIGQSSYSRLENGISELGANQLKVLQRLGSHRADGPLQISAGIEHRHDDGNRRCQCES